MSGKADEDFENVSSLLTSLTTKLIQHNSIIEAVGELLFVPPRGNRHNPCVSSQPGGKPLLIDLYFTYSRLDCQS